MKALAKWFYKFTGYVDFLAKWFSIATIAGMALVVVMQVVLRYIVKSPPPWTEELARYLMIWTSFVAMGAMIRNWDCVKVDLLVDKLGPRAARAANILLRLAVFGIAVYMTYLCIKVYPRVTRFQRAPALGINMIYPSAGIIAGMIMISLQALASICGELVGENAEQREETDNV